MARVIKCTMQASKKQIVYHCGKKQIDPFTKLFKNASTFVRPAFKKSKFLLNFDKSASAEWL